MASDEIVKVENRDENDRKGKIKSSNRIEILKLAMSASLSRFVYSISKTFVYQCFDFKDNHLAVACQQIACRVKEKLENAFEPICKQVNLIDDFETLEMLSKRKVLDETSAYLPKENGFLVSPEVIAQEERMKVKQEELERFKQQVREIRVIRTNLSAQVSKKRVTQASLLEKLKSLVEPSHATLLERREQFFFVSPLDTIIKDIACTVGTLQPGDTATKIITNEEDIHIIRNRFNISDKSFPISCHIQLLSTQNCPHIQSIFNQKLSKALELKEKGNIYYNKRMYKKSTIKYCKSLSYLSIPQECQLSEDEKAKVNSLAATCRLNLAACFLAIGNRESIDKCISYCSEVLQQYPTNVKALFRRGKAHTAAKDYDQSILDFLSASKLKPDNEKIEHALSQARKRKQSRKLNGYRTFSQFSFFKSSDESLTDDSDED